MVLGDWTDNLNKLGIIFLKSIWHDTTEWIALLVKFQQPETLWRQLFSNNIKGSKSVKIYFELTLRAKYIRKNLLLDHGTDSSVGLMVSKFLTATDLTISMTLMNSELIFNARVFLALKARFYPLIRNNSLWSPSIINIRIYIHLVKHTDMFFANLALYLSAICWFSALVLFSHLAYV